MTAAVTYINPAKTQWQQLLQRNALQQENITDTVKNILIDVQQNGDAAVKKYCQKFDGFCLDNFKTSEKEIEDSEQLISQDLRDAIQVAYKNIYNFHSPQMQLPQAIETTSGVTCWRKSVGIQNVALYIPGGTAPLFSTLLMLGVPASIAGCKNIQVFTPCNASGQIHPAILYVAKLLKLTNVYKIGGVQAIAAATFGTETITKSDKIFGPGNRYVTKAKQLATEYGVAIDMPAGPSEVAVYADATCKPNFVASDLLSQAEHGADSQVVLVASEEAVVKQVQACITEQLKTLPRNEVAKKALAQSRFVVFENANEAFDFLNAYAAEHLIIASDKASEFANKVVNAGSVFLGHYTPESAGDYASGTNHTLPTNGYATAYSGVSVDSFVKKITFQNITQQGIKTLSKTIITMAEAEELQAHANAVKVRINN